MASSSASSLRQKIRALAVAAGARDRPAAQRAVHMDRPAGDDLGARGDRPDDRDVALGEDHRLAGAHRPVQQQRGGGPRLGGRRRGLGAVRHLDHPGGAAAGHQRRQAPGLGAEPGRVGALDPDQADVALLQVVDQRRQVLLAHRQGRQVDHHRSALEEGRRALDLGVELGEPVRDRRFRRQDERHEGATTEADGGAGGAGCCCHGQGRSRARSGRQQRGSRPFNPVRSGYATGCGSQRPEPPCVVSWSFPSRPVCKAFADLARRRSRPRRVPARRSSGDGKSAGAPGDSEAAGDVSAAIAPSGVDQSAAPASKRRRVSARWGGGGASAATGGFFGYSGTDTARACRCSGGASGPRPAVP